MDEKEIIEMAKLAGWELDDSLAFEPTVIWYLDTDQLEAFAKLVAKAKAEELATALEKGPVNDTAASIAIWIRQQNNV